MHEPARSLPGRVEDGPDRAERPAPASGRTRRRGSGVSVVVGGLLQDLEEQMRRGLAPVEERVRPGEEICGLAGEAGGAADPLVIVLPPTAADPNSE